MDSFLTSVKKTSKVAVQPTEATGPSRHLYMMPLGDLLLLAWESSGRCW